MELVGSERVMPGKGFPEGVDRTGSDIAEHDSDRAKRKLRKRTLRGMAGSMMRVGHLVIGRNGLGGWSNVCHEYRSGDLAGDRSGCNRLAYLKARGL